MKDIGYYAGFLSTEQQEQLNSAKLYQLTECLNDLAADLIYNLYILDDTAPDQFDSLLGVEDIQKISDRDKVALIRGLCDRIELKLMETAI